MDENIPGPSPTNKRISKLVYGILIFLGLTVALFLYWQFSGSDVLTINNSPIPVSKISPTPTADGQVVFRVDYCKNVKASGIVRTSFVGDARELFLPVYTDNQGKGCNLVDLPVIVPRDLVPGKYHVHFRIVYRVNPIKTTIEEFDSREFTVK